MNHHEKYPVFQIERAIIWRMRWMLPFALAVILPAFFVYLRAVILLDGSAANWPGWGMAVTLAALGFAGGKAALFAWSISLRVSSRSLRSWRVIASLAVLLMISLDRMMGQSRLQQIVCTAIKHRAHPERDFFIRNAAVFNTAGMEQETPSTKPRLIVLGSSQLNLGLDHERLQKMLPSLQVERRSVAGMGPVGTLMTSPQVGIRPGDIVLVYWSEFDVGAMSITILDANWLRPFGNTAGLASLLAHMNNADVSLDLVSRLDVHVSSWSSFWRMRDGWSLLVHRLAGDAGGDEGSMISRAARLEEQKTGYALGLEREETFRMGLAAAQTLVRSWRKAGAEVVVMEGSVNPVMHQIATAERKQEVVVALREDCMMHGARFVPAGEQVFRPQPEHWVDGTHLNEEARKAFTLYVGSFLKRMFPANNGVNAL